MLSFFSDFGSAVAGVCEEGPAAEPLWASATSSAVLAGKQSMALDHSVCTVVISRPQGARHEARFHFPQAPPGTAAGRRRPLSSPSGSARTAAISQRAVQEARSYARGHSLPSGAVSLAQIIWNSDFKMRARQVLRSFPKSSGGRGCCARGRPNNSKTGVYRESKSLLPNGKPERQIVAPGRARKSAPRSVPRPNSGGPQNRDLATEDLVGIIFPLDLIASIGVVRMQFGKRGARHKGVDDKTKLIQPH
jgi:hypothetical protein